MTFLSGIKKIEIFKDSFELKSRRRAFKNFEKRLVCLEVSEREFGLTSVLAFVLNGCTFFRTLVFSLTLI